MVKMDMNKFLSLKALEEKRVNFEMSYVDMAKGDLIAGLLLSQIVYWFLPSKEGKHKTRATYKGRRAIAKNRDDWYDEIRVTPRQYDRGIKILQELNIVDVENSMFNGKRTPFIILNNDIFLELYEKELSRYNETVTPISRESNIGNNQSVKPLTETTTKTTTEITSYKEYNGRAIAQRDVATFSFDILDKQIEKIMASSFPDGYVGNLTTEDIQEFFKMYYQHGHNIRRIKPTKLKNEQVENIIKSIAYIGEEEFSPGLSDYKIIIENYFHQDFADCDYGINHFVSGDVLLMRCYSLRNILGL